VADNLSMGIIHMTFLRLEKWSSEKRLTWALFHSDQGFHYTHPYFQSQLRKLGCIQSMSRKWNCIDNAPTESFFGHMKDELDLSLCGSLQDVEKTIENYIFYYNHWRPQWSRKKMTPVQYRDHLIQLHL
jgi:transposase InsO family protein